MILFRGSIELHHSQMYTNKMFQQVHACDVEAHSAFSHSMDSEVKECLAGAHTSLVVPRMDLVLRLQ